MTAPAATTPRRLTIDELLESARERIDRVTPSEAHLALREGALLVDTRPEIYREAEGSIPGALVIERNVLEWRLDPASDAAIAQASYDAHVIVFCNEGYASSLAAAALRGLGIHRAADLIGGYRAWRSQGLPVRRGDFSRTRFETTLAVTDRGF